MNHIRGFHFAGENPPLTLSPDKRILRIAAEGRDRMKPEIGHALSKPFWLFPYCPAFFIFLEYRVQG